MLGLWRAIEPFNCGWRQARSVYPWQKVPRRGAPVAHWVEGDLSRLVKCYKTWLYRRMKELWKVPNLVDPRWSGGRNSSRAGTDSNTGEKHWRYRNISSIVATATVGPLDELRSLFRARCYLAEVGLKLVFVRFDSPYGEEVLEDSEYKARNAVLAQPIEH